MIFNTQIQNIDAISTATLVTKSITANGTYDATDDSADGYSEITVNVQPSLQTKSNISPTTSSQTIQPDNGYYGLSSVQINAMPSGSATTPATSITVTPNVVVDQDGQINVTVSASQSVTPTVSAGYVSSGTAGTVSVSGVESIQLTTTNGGTITPTESVQTAVARKVYTLGEVKVGAISSTYVGSEIAQRDSTDLSALGATISVPAGYYASGASKSVTSGTAGTPTATKGTVNNHSISVTPNVTNQTGYITGGTKTGTAVTVSASELVSGTKSITANGTAIDVTNYAAVNVDIPTQSSGLTIDDIAMDMISGTISGNASYINQYAFYYHSRIRALNFPSCETIGIGAFAYCSSLNTASFSSCTYIGSNAFAKCSKLSTIYFPLCQTISVSAFFDCFSLAAASFPSCTTVWSCGFSSCGISIADFPLCTTIGQSAFQNCRRLATVNFPNCTTISAYGFQYNYYSLLTADFPLCKSIGDSAFACCYGLTTLNIPQCKNIGRYAFNKCYSLISLNLTSVSVVPSLGGAAFSSTPIGGYSASAGQYGSVYVPASLYSSFLTATNWSSISSRIVSV